MKIAVTGKGGVGKTTTAAILARLYADEGRNVLAADVDPDANLGMALGFTEEELEDVTPISKMRKLIAERTGAGAETFGKFFKIKLRSGLLILSIQAFTKTVMLRCGYMKP